MKKSLPAIAFLLLAWHSCSCIAADGYLAPVMDTIGYYDTDPGNGPFAWGVGAYGTNMVGLESPAESQVYMEFRLSDIIPTFGSIQTLDLKFNVTDGSGIPGVNVFIQPYTYNAVGPATITDSDRIGFPTTNTLVGSPISLTSAGYSSIDVKSIFQNAITNSQTHVGFALYTTTEGTNYTFDQPPSGNYPTPSGFPTPATPVLAWTTLAGNSPPTASLAGSGQFGSTNYLGTPVTLNAGASNDPDIDANPGGLIANYAYTMTNSRDASTNTVNVASPATTFNPTLDQSMIRRTTDTALVNLVVTDNMTPPPAASSTNPAQFTITYDNNAGGSTSATTPVLTTPGFSASNTASISASSTVSDPDLAVNATYAAFEELSYTFNGTNDTQVGTTYTGSAAGAVSTNITFNQWLNSVPGGPGGATTLSTSNLTLTVNDRLKTEQPINSDGGAFTTSSLSIAYANADVSGGIGVSTNVGGDRVFTGNWSDLDLNVNGVGGAPSDFERITWTFTTDLGGAGDALLNSYGATSGFGTSNSNPFPFLTLSDAQQDALAALGVSQILFTINDRLGGTLGAAGLQTFSAALLAETPEPAAIILWTMLGVVGMGVWRFRRRKAA